MNRSEFMSLKDSDHDPLRDLEEAEELLADLNEPGVPGWGGASSPSHFGEPSLQEMKAKAQAASESEAFKALADVATTITANLDFPSLARQILDTAIQTVGAERGIIFLGDDRDEELVPMVARSLRGEDVGQIERVSRTVLRRGREGHAISTGDAVNHPGLVDSPSIQLNQLRSIISTPLAARGQTIGVLYVDSPDRTSAFPSYAEKFLVAFGGLAAVAIENARLHGDIMRENRRLRRRLHSMESFGRIVTVSPKMVSMLRRASMVAQSDAPIMILGESGTGKELLARSIHESGPRSLNAFVAHNCAAVPKELMESLFFGHTKGAFTGATRDSIGLFRQADRGTLFLDEFADLNLELQAKFLRVLEDGLVRPVGGQHEVQVDFRLLTATSRSMDEAVERGAFREDLFYRTNVLEVRIPPLRERLEDIPVLVDHFRDKHTVEGRGSCRFSSGAIELMQSLPWRGNVRELENVVQRVLILCEKPVVEADEVRRLVPRPLRIRLGDVPADGRTDAHSGFAAGSAGAGAGSGAGREPGISGEIRDSGANPAAASSGWSEPNEQGEVEISSSTVLPSPSAPPPETLEQQEKLSIARALVKAGGNKSKAARILGLHRNSLLRRLEKLQIVWID